MTDSSSIAVALGHAPHPWDGAVRDAAEETHADLAAATAFELACLWSDLSYAIHVAYNGSWSVGCDNLVVRIIVLTRLAGPTPWDQVQLGLLSSGTYQGILDSAGIAYDPPDMAEVQRLEAQLAEPSATH